jgi:hypothetical protein
MFDDKAFEALGESSLMPSVGPFTPNDTRLLNFARVRYAPFFFSHASIVAISFSCAVMMS